MKQIAFLFLLLSTQLGARESVTLGILSFPPYARIDELTNQCVGIFITNTKAILAAYDIDLDVVCAPPIRIYRMLKNAEVDFTINVKSTKALPQDIVFVDIPYSTLHLDFYAHNDIQMQKSVAAIRGFSYHGFRTRLVSEGYDFIDLPTSISAIQLFLKKRSSHLITYRAPAEYYIREKNVDISDKVTIVPLVNVPTYYAISGQSPHLEKLKSTFNDYASKRQLSYFNQDQ